jgi:DNA-binding HxlR family transcriptional regulator
MGSKRIGKAECDPSWCPIEVALEVIGGMWKVIIVRELTQGTLRYSQLHRALKRVTHKMLAQQLRELERDGVISRKVYPQVPPKVEYTLTPLGEALQPLLDSMQAWGHRVMAHHATSPSGRPGLRQDTPAPDSTVAAIS